jgi:hypothetical protein
LDDRYRSKYKDQEELTEDQFSYDSDIFIKRKEVKNADKELEKGKSQN